MSTSTAAGTTISSDRAYTRRSLDLTKRWLERGWRHYKDTEPLYGHYQSYFPIVQGCTYPDLRIEAAKHVCGLDADGYAIGGLAVGEPAEVKRPGVHPHGPPALAGV